jgi:hypothetical protein
MRVESSYRTAFLPNSASNMCPMTPRCPRTTFRVWGLGFVHSLMSLSASLHLISVCDCCLAGCRSCSITRHRVHHCMDGMMLASMIRLLVDHARKHDPAFGLPPSLVVACMDGIMLAISLNTRFVRTSLSASKGSASSGSVRSQRFVLSSTSAKLQVTSRNSTLVMCVHAGTLHERNKGHAAVLWTHCHPFFCPPQLLIAIGVIDATSW